MIAFIDDHRGAHRGRADLQGTCRLPRPPIYDHLAKRPTLSGSRIGRSGCGAAPEIERVFEENWRVYGVRKVWHQMGGRASMSPAARWRG
jgi:putative transposase